jgi:hypothetical protein
MSLAVNVKRALGWNLGRVVPSPKEVAALTAAGIVDPAAQRYAAWRRSLLLVAFVPTFVAAVFGLLNVLESDFGGATTLGMVLELAWLAAVVTLPIACLLGTRKWTRPSTGSALLLWAWAAAFLAPFVQALMPAEWLEHVLDPELPAVAAGVAETAAQTTERLHLEKLEALSDLALNFVISAPAYILLLPTIMSLIPGAMNGCLRIKSVLPAASLPGWLLVCASPLFLLFWLILLLMANEAAQSGLLVFGVLVWAGSPIVYALAGRVFVRSQISEADAAKIGRVKRVVGLVGLCGIAILATFALRGEILGLRVIGFEAETAMSTRLDALMEDESVSGEDVAEAFASAQSLTYGADPSYGWLILDVLSKLLIATAVFGHLVLGATLTAWRNDKDHRGRPESAAYDASAAALSRALGQDPAATT